MSLNQINAQYKFGKVTNISFSDIFGHIFEHVISVQAMAQQYMAAKKHGCSTMFEQEIPIICYGSGSNASYLQLDHNHHIIFILFIHIMEYYNFQLPAISDVMAAFSSFWRMLCLIPIHVTVYCSTMLVPLIMYFGKAIKEITMAARHETWIDQLVRIAHLSSTNLTNLSFLYLSTACQMTCLKYIFSDNGINITTNSTLTDLINHWEQHFTEPLSWKELTNKPFKKKSKAVTGQYSIFEQFGFSLVPMDSAAAIVFNGTSAIVDLPWAFTFDSTAYTTATVYQNGIISFGVNQVLAAYAVANATAVSAKSFTCTAPFPAGACFAVQWTQGKLTTQAVLTQSGDAYFVYSGNGVDTRVSSQTYITTSATYTTYPAALWTDWLWTVPSDNAIVALRVTPRGATGLLSLPFIEDFEGALSPSRWSHLICGAIGSTCGSASGNKALTFVRTKERSRSVVSYGIDVSACASVSVAYVLGPSAASGNCTPVARAFMSAIMNHLHLVGPTWTESLRRHADTIEIVEIPPGTTSMNLMWDLMHEDGMWFLDDIRVTCAPPMSESSSQSAQSSDTRLSNSAQSSAVHQSSQKSASVTSNPKSASATSNQKSGSAKSSYRLVSSSKGSSLALRVCVLGLLATALAL
eukprot:m51a1_g948 hypothetical protein (637) ;mRNA; f:278271-283492